MDSNHFDAIVRIASSSRRSTVATMLAATGGLAALTMGEAKQKKKGQDCGKKERQRCAADAEACRAVLLARCEADPASCQAQAGCCAACSADGMLNCLLALPPIMAATRMR